MAITKQKGDIAEAFITFLLKQNGFNPSQKSPGFSPRNECNIVYSAREGASAFRPRGSTVLIPWGEDGRYDIAAEKKGIFKRIQVKYVTPKNGVLEVAIRSSNNFNIIHYSPNDLDIIAAYNPESNKAYFIPIDTIKNRRVCKLRLKPAKNKQKKRIVLASKYEFRFDLLEK